MSVFVSAWVWANAPVKSGELVVLLALADNAHDDGGGAYPSREHLAAKSRMTVRQVARCLSTLEDKSLIRRCGETQKGIVVWRILIGGQNVTGDTSVPRGGHERHPEPSDNRQTESLSTGAGAPEKPVTYRGKRVPKTIVGDAEAALAVFNEMTGRALSTRTGDGSASAVLKQVIGAMLERPSVTRDDWTRAVRNTCSNPPDWVKGQMQIGYIFGERAAEHALSNDGYKRVTVNGNGRGGVTAQGLLSAMRPRTDIEGVAYDMG